MKNLQKAEVAIRSARYPLTGLYESEQDDWSPYETHERNSVERAAAVCEIKCAMKNNDSEVIAE